MPFKIKKVEGGYEVLNAETGKIHARHTTLAKAKAQIRIMDEVFALRDEDVSALMGKKPGP